MTNRNATLAVFAVFSLLLFIIWGALVRRGTLKDRNILWSGLLLGILAMALSLFMQYPDYAAGRLSFGLMMLNLLLMAWVTLFCVVLSYRNQRVEDIATYTIGDTKIIVRSATVSSLPDAQAMLLPTLTNLKMVEGIAGIVALATGSGPQRELRQIGPVGMGKVVQTSGGTSKVGRIFHVAVSDPLKSVDADRLRKGMEAAAQQARKAHAESLVVPLGPLRGLPLISATDAIVGGVLRQRKAFAEIVFVVLETRHKKTAHERIDRAVAELLTIPEAGKRPS